MTEERVSTFIITNAKYFPAGKIGIIKDRVERLDDSKIYLLSSIDYKEPTTLLLVSLFGGPLGIDRFLLGEVGLGILKLVTFGCCGFWTIFDWFTIIKRTKDLNFQKFIEVA